MGVKVTRTSQFSGKDHTLELPITQEEWEAGKARSWKLNPGVGTEHIQKCFPMLSAEHREFLISGITPAEWEALFGEQTL